MAKSKRQLENMELEEAIEWVRNNDIIKFYDVDDLKKSAKDNIYWDYYDDAIGIIELLRDNETGIFVEDRWGGYESINNVNDLIYQLDYQGYRFADDYEILKSDYHYFVFKYEDNIYHLILNDASNHFIILKDNEATMVGCGSRDYLSPLEIIEDFINNNTMVGIRYLTPSVEEKFDVDEE